MGVRSTDGVVIEHLASPNLSDPILLEGLPGVGNVGALVVEHLIEERESSLCAPITSEHLPPQVDVDESGVASLPCLEVHAVETAVADFLCVTGDHQATNPIGHYRLTSAVLDITRSLDVSAIYALGGVPTGEVTSDPAVVGAVSRQSLCADAEAAGVVFREYEPQGGILGVSGLLLGLGAEAGFDVTCLMGETSGYLVDPTSATAVLSVLEQWFGFEISYDRLEARAEAMEPVVERVQQLQEEPTEPSGGEDLRYIG